MFYQLPDGTEDYLEIDESMTIEGVSKNICEKYNFDIEKVSLFTDGTMTEELDYMPEEDYKLYVGIDTVSGNSLVVREEIKSKLRLKATPPKIHLVQAARAKIHPSRIINNIESLSLNDLMSAYVSSSCSLEYFKYLCEYINIDSTTLNSRNMNTSKLNYVITNKFANIEDIFDIDNLNKIKIPNDIIIKLLLNGKFLERCLFEKILNGLDDLTIVNIINASKHDHILDFGNVIPDFGLITNIASIPDRHIKVLYDKIVKDSTIGYINIDSVIRRYQNRSSPNTIRDMLLEIVCRYADEDALTVLKHPSITNYPQVLFDRRLFVKDIRLSSISKEVWEELPFSMQDFHILSIHSWDPNKLLSTLKSYDEKIKIMGIALVDIKNIKDNILLPYYHLLNNSQIDNCKNIDYYHLLQITYDRNIIDKCLETVKTIKISDLRCMSMDKLEYISNS